MDLLSEIFYRPIVNTLALLLTAFGGNMGLAIILLTILVRFILYVPTRSSLESQRRLQALQPKINELKKIHKGNNEAFSKELMKLYSTEKVNPFSSCLSILIQLPFLIALYAAFQAGLGGNGFVGNDTLYSFIPKPGAVSTAFIGIELARPSIVMAVFAGISQYVQARLMPRTAPVAPGDGGKDEHMMAAMNTQMLYVMPVVTIVIGMGIPSGLTLYWALSTILFIVQQAFALRVSRATTM